MNENQVSQIPPGAKITFTVANDLTTYEAEVFCRGIAELDPRR